MRLREGGRELQCAHARRIRTLEVRRRCIEILIKKGAAVGNAGVRECVFRIELDSALEHLTSVLVTLPSMLVKVLTSAKIETIRFDVRSVHLLDRTLLVVAQ